MIIEKISETKLHHQTYIMKIFKSEMKILFSTWFYQCISEINLISDIILK